MNLDIFDGMAGELTQTHIDNGLRDLCSECPVALCISEMVAKHKAEIGAVVVEVGAKQLRLHTSDWEAPLLTAELDRQLTDWIEDFDCGLPVRAGRIYIKRDAKRIQRWHCGIEHDA